MIDHFEVSLTWLSRFVWYYSTWRKDHCFTNETLWTYLRWNSVL